MKKVSKIVVFSLSILAFAAFNAHSQESFVLENPGKLFKKQDYRITPLTKTRYQFGVGETSGREYLRQQDLHDASGKIKSSGLFAEDGNKSADIRYEYGTDGSLQKSILKYIGKDHQEITNYNASGMAEKTEHLTKTDSMLYVVRFSYDQNGHLLEEQKFKGESLISKQVYDDTYNAKGRRIQLCHYMIDSTGSRKPQNAAMTIMEYDPDGLVLQVTKYNNKEKRKMLSWVYYKYQLDNDYKVIKQTGFDEEQKEIYRNELSYTDSSIISTVFSVCDCPEKSMVKKEDRVLVFNSYGRKIREIIKDANDKLVSTHTWKYDEFGNEVEHQEVLTSDPSKLIKSKQILEFKAEQAQAVRKK